MAPTRTITLPLNRVEGDLEVTVEIDGDAIVDARCSGTLYRGFENLLTGRAAIDSLVMTPRICGICGVAHLTAAVTALEQACSAHPPRDARALRNVGLAVEYIQSDLRQHVLMFCADLTNPAFAGRPWFDEAGRRYTPVTGSSALSVLDATRKVVEIAALIGGQWPHSEYMVPGGLASSPSVIDLLACRRILHDVQRWYEETVLGCDLATWSSVRSGADLDTWLEASDSHHRSELGFLLRVGRDLGLDSLGRGHGGLLCFAAFPATGTDAGHLFPGGVRREGQVDPVDHTLISEDHSHAWYEGALPQHPWEGSTTPVASPTDEQAYSWAKAPRYQRLPMETGALAELAVAGHPLIDDLLGTGAGNVLVRQIARLVRTAVLLPAVAGWLEEVSGEGSYYERPPTPERGRVVGLTGAPRGALGHWVELDQGLISHYQIITPTAWNASPRDVRGVRGPIEEALVGTPIQDLGNPVELGLVVRSFDPCLVCTVHTLDRQRGRRSFRVGL